MLDQNERDLRDYQRKVDADEAYAEALESKTAELMAKGAEFYPYSLANFGEALCEGCTEDADKAAKLFEIAEDASEDFLRLVAYRAINEMVTEYWLKMAAERAYDLLEEMRDEN